MPWAKSVTITAICPPASVKKSAIVRRTIMTRAKTQTLSGSPQK